MSTTFTLSRPITHGSTEITELEFRTPSTKDVNALGMPSVSYTHLTLPTT